MHAVNELTLLLQKGIYCSRIDIQYLIPQIQTDVLSTLDIQADLIEDFYLIISANEILIFNLKMEILYQSSVIDIYFVFTLYLLRAHEGLGH